MRRFNKLICLLTALVLCLLSVSCGVISSEDGDYKIISSDELSVLAEAATVDFSNPENSKVTLGAYGGKALGWTVVNVDREGVATLLCDEIIEYKQFNDFKGFPSVRGNETADLYDELNVMDWANSSIRKWLNGEFLVDFSETDLARIYGGELVTVDNPVTRRGACVTEDKVFLLSADEAANWLGADGLACTATADAVENGVRVASNGNSPWWLRSVGSTMWHAAVVNADGTVNYSGMDALVGRAGVRPCIRLVSTAPGGEQAVDIAEAVKGNIVTFGKYEQDNDSENGAEDIRWRVLDIEGSKKLLVSVDVLDQAKFHSSVKGVTWEDSALREWLGGSFADAAFSDAEKAAIVTVKNTTADNFDYVIDSGNDTNDSVFVLSREQVEEYFHSNSYGWELAKPSEYADNAAVYSDDGETLSIYEKGVQKDPNRGTCGYWLRNAGQNSMSAMFVNYYGAVNSEGSLVRNTYLGVRPCIWVDTALVTE